jgi:hypothetical protein
MHGVTLVWSDEVTKPKTTGEVAVKYKKGNESWTGRGLTPKWVINAIAETIGNTPDENTFKKAVRENNKEKIAYYWEKKPNFILEALKALEV